MRRTAAFMTTLLAATPAWAFQPATQPPAVSPAPSENHAAVTPANRLSEAWWKDRHEKALEKVKTGGIDVLFIGDSITQGWEGAGKEAWQKSFEPMHALNLGFSGDRTQHVLWRLDNGEIAGLKPKAAVLMIGTNNSNGNDHSAPQIADGIEAVVAKLRAKLPDTRILILGIFPRGEEPNPQREKLDEVNKVIAKLADGKHVHYLDIGPAFLQPDGTLTKEIMPDALHLSAKGYQIWADSISGKLGELVGK